MRLHTYPSYTIQELMVHSEAEKKGFLFVVEDAWDTTKPNQINNLRDRTWEIFAEADGDSRHTLYIRTEHAIFHATTYNQRNRAYMTVFAESREYADEIISLVKKYIPVAPPTKETDISVRFWYLTNNGPMSVHRNIAAPSWQNMDLNYESATKQGLSKLMMDFKPSSGGKLILWHGQPGTGKTYALRALCQAWKTWCSSEYILDPETLLGASPGYLANMLMDSAETDDDEEEHFLDSEVEAEIKNIKRWKLFIMEDTGELLTENARERAGQGLSRLLNVVDGFIGQGLRVLVLITTNEEFEKLHPAVSREGRCAASIKFHSLGMEESQKFLIANNSQIKLSDRYKVYTLAELYAMIKSEQMPHDRDGKEPAKPFGFQLPVSA